ncbi:MAG: GAF and ANTAR domain-containing protein [Actinobacteria bacterium]|nr:GAF and ANTAR domain-containing protein [Actinomycetota bacterium]
MSNASEDVVHVAEVFAEVARALSAHEGLEATLHKIVNLAVEHLEACEFAGISLVERGKITSPASSNDIPKGLDTIQSDTGEGPCIDAINEHEVFQTGDLLSECRWPNFSKRAHEETGVCSILSLRLFIEGDTMGALNLYSTRSNAFDDTDVALASVFAAHAAVAMSAVRREEQLERKAQTRDLIGQAKGILMTRSGVTDDEAFAMLQAASQRMNIKLRDVALQVAERKPVAEAPQP